ncbi:anaphase-promoting complex, cyclosome, subunit 4-domain-containing protein [Massariosphaeria phaeospora]|uniref:Anaphase-promoting complex subunit 4 n=1 Tax=Massariosphaeria phaeospora TaxID=100035 RepID=A0A7C8MC61_9PLEO|nr:anaphase-promoting complex, cyclosome, subunit 4-domain-containing protein [Massariosphaeria phaeospora]
MDDSSGPKLLLQAEKILLHPIHPHLISYCPTMDLIALVTDEENLDVYRINGQRAFGLKRKSLDETIDAICWEFNGQAIAVAWSDGFTDILSSETGKVIHKDLPPPITSSEAPRIQCMGWGLNFIDVDAVKRRTGLRTVKTDVASPGTGFGASTTEEWDAFKDGTSLEDFLQRQPDLQILDIAPDLPDQLAMMDIEMLLPKLPAIPAAPALPFMRAPQVDSGTFATQAQVDALLHSHHTKDHNSVDMFIRCTDKGTVHPSIYDSLETVNVQLPSAWAIESKPILHTSHPYSCSHGLLIETKSATPDSRKKLAFVPLTLGFIPSAGNYLHLIASKTSQLQNLLQYIQQTLQRICTFWKQSQDLPSKFMRNISETLEEKGMDNLVQSLYHIACTGNCPPIIHEWLVDELAEQGHKRWDHAVTSSLTMLLALLHENLLPALDRCSIVLSRLRGLAQYHDQEWIFSCPISDFTSLLETSKNIRLLAHTTLLYATDEKRQFHAFSKWLRFCIDFEATEPDSQSRLEMEARDPGVDIGLVLEYIQFALTKSDLTSYLRPEEEPSSEQKATGLHSYADTRKAVDLLKEGARFKEEALCLEHVVTGFEGGVRGLMRQVSVWQEGNSSMDAGIVLEDTWAGGVVDARMVFEPTQPSHISTHIATTTPSSRSHLHLHTLVHTTPFTPLSRALSTYAVSTLSFPASSSILDAAFADDKSLLVLLQAASSSASASASPPASPEKDPDREKTYILLSLPYTTSTNPSSASTTISLAHSLSASLVPHIPIPTSTTSTTFLPTGTAIPTTTRTPVSITPEILQAYTKHVFEGRFTPLKLVVNGRKGRRVVVVLGSDRKHYRVLDLDFRGKREGKGKKEGDDDGEGSDSDSGSGSSSSEDSDVEMLGV